LKKKYTYCLILLLGTTTCLSAQKIELGNTVEKVVVPTGKRLQVDSLSIFYATLEVIDAASGQYLDTAYYHLESNVLHFHEFPLPADSLQLRYRRLPYALESPLQRLDTAEAEMLEEGVIGVTYNPYERDESLLNFKGLDYNGNFTRGISFGNNQDLVLNSSFNLQLAGELGDGIEILAAITDENIPLQPEGNTQQLQEFDRIFVQLRKNNTSLTAGDYELQRPDSYFMNYFKKLQGATFSQSEVALAGGMLKGTASVAISRGQFTRNQINAIEGNQGPYRLRGSQGERFIIVLAGTEKVFLDGVQLSRGLEQDYVIDYNRGEVTFTNKQLITKDSRIVVEFEYADQAYVRSLYAAGASYERKRLKLDVNVYSQQDSKNATGDLNLTEQEKRILSEAGDDAISAVSSGVDSLEEFTPYRVSYRQLDTVLACFPDTAFTYLDFTTNPDSAAFTARFSFVGRGNGQYVLDESQAANERVYRWVGYGADCQPLGDYEPVVQLVPPQQQRMLTVGGQYRLAANGSLEAEVAFSENNLNRFSALDRADDTGMAAFLNYGHKIMLGPDSNSWQLDTRLSYELVQKHFTHINPYRNPEFLRDWNLANVQGVGSVDAAREQIGIGSVNLQRAKLGSLGYSFSTFLRDSLYTGFRHRLQLRSQLPKWDINIDGSLLDTESKGVKGRFLRPRGTIARVVPILGGLKVGAFGELEQSTRRAIGVDSLNDASFYFHRFRFFMETTESEQYTLGASASQRIDYAPIGNIFQTSTTASEGNVNGSWNWQQTGSRLRIAGNLTYRKLEIALPEQVNQEAGETYLGRGDLSFSLAKGTFQSATTYELGSGQEPKVEFTYVQVNPGEGNYVWLDSLYNNDGIIQPNEMEIAPFQDLANYIRVSAVTDDFIRTDNVNLNQSLRISPKAIWYSKKGVRKLMSRFSTISNFSIKRKTQKAEGVAPYNPFQLDVADTALVAISSSVRNVLFFNQADPVYDLQLGMQDNRNKFVQTSGFESRSNTERFIKGRWNISRKWSTRVELMQGSRTSDSEFFNDKDFEIASVSLSPECSFLPTNSFRTKVKYRFQQDENVLDGSGGEQAERNELEFELRYNRSARRAIQANFSYIDIQFEGEPNSPVGFAILNGLQQGRNYIWNVSLDQQLSKNIQLRLSYEGRKTGSANVVHTGRAQLAANF